MISTDPRTKRFEGWAEGQGGEVIPITNEYELARIKHAEGTFVIYRNKKNTVSFSDSLARQAWAAFLQKRPFNLMVRHKRTKTEKMVVRLKERDGNACFFCAEPFSEELPPTLEHLLAISKGGNNHLANLCLSCEVCNRTVGSDDVAEKIKYRDTKRSIKCQA